VYGFEELHTRRAPSSMQTIRAKYLIVVVGSALMGVASLSLPGLAQDQVLKNCREEWRASQAALRANGMTEKVYVSECQGAAGNASAQSPASPDSQTNPASATLPHATAGETLKVKACVEEWRTKRRTKRGTDELKGLTEKAYIEQCRSASTSPVPSSGAASSR
jgi:hypothetical protein